MFTTFRTGSELDLTDCELEQSVEYDEYVTNEIRKMIGHLVFSVMRDDVGSYGNFQAWLPSTR